MSVLTTISKLSPFKVLGHRFVSKWVVLAIDLLLISISLIISFLLLSNSQLHGVSLIEYYKGVISVMIFAVIGHYVFKPHLGLIRHTTLHDIRRVFLARFTSFVLNIIYISYLSHIFNIHDYAIPLRVSLVNFVISLYLLIQFRLGVKYIFNLGKRQKNKSKVMIYGAGITGHLVFDTILDTYDVVAFIDDNASIKGKVYKGVPIVLFDDNLPAFIEKNEVSQVILSIQKISLVQKRKIVDKCIELGVEVKVVPPPDQWIGGELRSSQIKKVKIDELLGRDVINLDNRLLQYKLQDKTILVTGAAGSIGSEIVKQLVHYKPKQIILVDCAETPLYHIELELLQQRQHQIELKVILADVRDERTMKEIFETYQINWVFHAAAYKHVPTMEMHPKEAIKINILGTQIIADLADTYKVEKMVFISTDKAVNPTNVMGATKRAAEMYVQSKNAHSNTAFITTRFGNVLGSNGSVIPIFEKQILEGGPVKVTHPDITRYFMTIPEACQLVLEAGAMGEGGEIFVFDMGESVKILDLANRMIQLSGLTPGKDIEIMYTGLRPGEKLYEELLNDKESIIPTHHDKIMKAKVMQHNYYYVAEHIKSFKELIGLQASDTAIVSALKKLVPEYISKNSFFEKLDKTENSPSTPIENFS